MEKGVTLPGMHPIPTIIVIPTRPAAQCFWHAYWWGTLSMETPVIHAPLQDLVPKTLSMTAVWINFTIRQFLSSSISLKSTLNTLLNTLRANHAASAKRGVGLS